MQLLQSFTQEGRCWKTEVSPVLLLASHQGYELMSARSFLTGRHSGFKASLPGFCLSCHVTPHCRCLVHNWNAINQHIEVKKSAHLLRCASAVLLLIFFSFSDIHFKYVASFASVLVLSFWSLSLAVKILQVFFSRDVAFERRFRFLSKQQIRAPTAPDNQLNNQINQIRCRNSS